jgi:hypothetical protein
MHTWTTKAVSWWMIGLITFLIAISSPATAQIHQQKALGGGATAYVEVRQNGNGYVAKLTARGPGNCNYRRDLTVHSNQSVPINGRCNTGGIAGDVIVKASASIVNYRSANGFVYFTVRISGSVIDEIINPNLFQGGNVEGATLGHVNEMFSFQLEDPQERVRLEQERQRQIAEQRQRDEQARLEQQRQEQERQRLIAEQRQREEQARLERQRQEQERQRLIAEQRQREEQARLERQRQDQERQRLIAEQRQREEQALLERQRQPQQLSSITELVGAYRRNPVENSWHDGRIELDGQNLKWTNAAGVSWRLIPDLPHNVLQTDASNPYQISGGRDFTIDMRDGRLNGFRFQGELYQRHE